MNIDLNQSIDFLTELTKKYPLTFGLGIAREILKGAVRAYNTNIVFSHEEDINDLGLNKSVINVTLSLDNRKNYGYNRQPFKFSFIWKTGSGHTVELELSGKADQAGDNGEDLAIRGEVSFGNDESTIFYPDVKRILENVIGK